MISATGKSKAQRPTPIILQRRVNFSAFTLLEVCVVCFIIMLLIGITAPVISSLTAEQQLRDPERQLQLFAKTARRLAISEQRTYEMEFSETSFLLKAKRASESVNQTNVETRLFYQVPANISYRIQSWNEKEWKRPRDLRWVFQPSGLSEPLSFQFTRGKSSLTVSFNPLTAAVSQESYYFP